MESRPSKARLFVALDLPEDIKRSLEPLGQGLGDVRWLDSEQQHLTLRFLGQLDNGCAREVADADEHGSRGRAWDALVVVRRVS